MEIQFKRLHNDAVLPGYAHEGDAGMDLCACEDLVLKAGMRGMVKTGWSIALPAGTEGQVRPRSGLAFKHGVTVLNSPGTIDEGYRGEVGIILINHGDEDFVITVGMRIAQPVVAPILRVRVAEVQELSDTQRGVGGFGSSGTH